MRIQHPLARAISLVVASLLIAVVANGFAGRTRQLKLPGWYPHALRVPPKEQPAPKPIAETTTIAPTTTTAVEQPIAISVTTETIAVPTTTQQPSNPATPQPSLTTRQPDNPTTPTKPN